MPHVRTADGTRIHYETFEPNVEATAAPVVLLQGIGLPGRMWFEIPTALANDAGTPRKVIVIDNRGTGRSDKPRGVYNMRALANDVVSVLDEQAIERATIVGFSFGGMVAQHVALRHTHRVGGLVLMATGPGMPHGKWPSPRTLATLAMLGTGLIDPEKALATLLLPPHERHRVRELFGCWADVMAEIPTPSHGFLGQFGAGVSHATGFFLPRLDIPTVIVAGKLDGLIPVENSHKLASLLRRSHLELLDDVGHDIPVLQPDIVHRALRKLDELASSSAVSEAMSGPSNVRHQLARIVANRLANLASIGPSSHR